MVFSQINVKAAAITGAIIGFLCWLFFAPFGMMGYMMNYLYPSLNFLSVVIGAIIGAIVGSIVAVVYNWALKL